MSMLRKPLGATKQKKRVGRGQGTGNGTTAGKGNNGQNARSGGGVRPGFEGGQMPLYRRIARRGFSNYPFKVKFTVVDVSSLDRCFKDGDVVSIDTLREKNLIKNSEIEVKILGTGEITKKLTLEFVAVSASAKAKIEKAGGVVKEFEIVQDETNGE
ncbi:MAG: 50S ribosomal protein L15 [Spirochaetales bacterium]|nr:50S ribosomal protein L15 [Spirochaetales bacterium]